MRNTSVRWLVGLLVVFGIFLYWRKSRKDQPMEKIYPIDQDWMGNRRINLLPYIEAQARHESGNYSSRLAREQNNLFGMKKPLSRRFVGSKDSQNSYMTYDSYQQSVEDLFLWMDSMNFPVNVSGSGQYVNELKRRNYFEDNLKTYTDGVNSALKKIQSEGKNRYTFKITPF